MHCLHSLWACLLLPALLPRGKTAPQGGLTKATGLPQSRAGR